MNALKRIRMVQPGEVLTDRLKTLGLPASRLPNRQDAPANRFTTNLREQRGVTAYTDLGLTRYSRTRARVWPGLHTAFDVRRPRSPRLAKLPSAPRP